MDKNTGNKFSSSFRRIPTPASSIAYHNKLMQEADAIPDEEVLAWVNKNRKAKNLPPIKALSELERK
jgi:hypothetical protein